MKGPADCRPADLAPLTQGNLGIAASLRQVYAFMSPQRRLQFYGALALMLIGALAEIATIGAIVPFLSLLANQGESQQFRWFAPLFELFDARTPGQQLVAATILFMVAALVAAAIRLPFFADTNASLCRARTVLLCVSAGRSRLLRVVSGIIACIDSPPKDDGEQKAGGSVSPHALYNIGTAGRRSCSGSSGCSRNALAAKL